MLIIYLGTSPILALKSHILSEVHFIGKTGGAEIATCPCAHSWCAVELAFTPLWVQHLTVGSLAKAPICRVSGSLRRHQGPLGF